MNIKPLSGDIEKSKKEGYLTGQLLIAMPQLQDSFFARSVVYICAHNAEGAMGIMINKPLPSLTFAELMEQLNISDAEDTVLNERIHFGGPVETSRGFVLHSADYTRPGSLDIGDNLVVSTTLEILKDIAVGKGPQKYFMALGYAGWAPTQLESELHANGWLNVAADDALIFNTPLERKWHLALGKLGVKADWLAAEAGIA